MDEPHDANGRPSEEPRDERPPAEAQGRRESLAAEDGDESPRSEEEYVQGPVLNHPYSTGDAQEYGTGGGDVGIGGDVSPHGELHDVSETEHDVAAAGERFAPDETVDEAGYLELSGFPEEWPDGTEEAESEDDPSPEADSFPVVDLQREVNEPDEPFADVRDEDNVADDREDVA
jgi:hypothetical protein